MKRRKQIGNLWRTHHTGALATASAARVYVSVLYLQRASSKIIGFEAGLGVFDCLAGWLGLEAQGRWCELPLA